jgi:hypothetical protein
MYWLVVGLLIVTGLCNGSNTSEDIITATENGERGWTFRTHIMCLEGDSVGPKRLKTVEIMNSLGLLVCTEYYQEFRASNETENTKWVLQEKHFNEHGKDISIAKAVVVYDSDPATGSILKETIYRDKISGAVKSVSTFDQNGRMKELALYNENDTSQKGKQDARLIVQYIYTNDPYDPRCIREIHKNSSGSVIGVWRHLDPNSGMSINQFISYE